MKYINLILIFLFLTLPVKSDQLDTRLPNLFKKLHDSTNDYQINEVTKKIWISGMKRMILKLKLIFIVEWNQCEHVIL